MSWGPPNTPGPRPSRRAGISLRCRPAANGVWTLAAFIFSNGGAMMQDGRCVFDSEASIQAVEFYVRLLRDAGPPNIKHDWYEVLRDFRQGDAAMMLDTSNFAIDLATSPIAAQVVHAPFPGNGKRPAETNVWVWQAGINVHSQRKEAAFLFLCFVNSVPGCKFLAASGLAAPRPSAWAVPAFRDSFGKGAVDATVASIQAQPPNKYKAVWHHPESTLIRASLADVLFDSVTKGADVRAALKAQAAKVNQALGKT